MLMEQAWCGLGALVLIWTGTASVRAGTIRDDVSDSLYTQLATDPAYDAVGKFTWTEGATSYLASGTLIGNDWVLTAGHVVDSATAAAMSFELDGVTYGASELVAYDGWTGDVSQAGDLGLVHLTQSVPSVTPAILYDGSSEVGSTATVVGYGKTGTGLTGDIYPAGTKRAGNNLIGGLGDVIGYSTNSLMADFDYPDPTATGKAICLPLEYLAAPGDSGGGWFIEENGVSYLAGVTSFGYATDGYIDSSYSDIMGATRVSNYLDWIDSIVGIVAIPGDLNGDGYVGLDDLGFILDNWNQSVTVGDPLQGDIAGPGGGAPDGYVGLDDLQVVLDNWNQGTLPVVNTIVPEPATVWVLGCLGAFMLRRK